MLSVLDGCLDACHRCETVVRLAQTPAAVAAIGPHLRHCLDHFLCFFDGIGSGVVDYDARQRDRTLETNPAAALELLESLRLRLAQLEPALMNRTLEMRQTAAPGAPPVSVESNVQRELVFLSGHTVHHLAIMALLLREQGQVVPEGLDVAYSTAAHLTTR
jgi:uncharacterized damage-inducible protein DinB